MVQANMFQAEQRTAKSTQNFQVFSKLILTSLRCRELALRENLLSKESFFSLRDKGSPFPWYWHRNKPYLSYTRVGETETDGCTEYQVRESLLTWVACEAVNSTQPSPCYYDHDCGFTQRHMKYPTSLTSSFFSFRNSLLLSPLSCFLCHHLSFLFTPPLPSLMSLSSFSFL